ncbi:STAS domain-containing protein [bacterium]|nr:STAS domain-containing protein [bacterium]
MDIVVSARDEVSIIEISGHLDSNTAQEAQDTLMPLLSETSLIVIDLKQCSYVSSAGLRVLLMVGKQLTRLGGSGVLANLCAEIKDVMEMTGFDHIFQCYDSINDAIKALREAN